MAETIQVTNVGASSAEGAATPMPGRSAGSALRGGLVGLGLNAQIQRIQPALPHAHESASAGVALATPVQRSAETGAHGADGKEVRLQRKVSRTPTQVVVQRDALPENATQEQIDTYVDNLPGWLYKGNRGESYYRNLVRRLRLADEEGSEGGNQSAVAVDVEVAQQLEFSTFVIHGIAGCRRQFGNDLESTFRRLSVINSDHGRVSWAMVSTILTSLPESVGRMGVPLRPGAMATAGDEHQGAQPVAQGGQAGGQPGQPGQNVGGGRSPAGAAQPPTPHGAERPGNGTGTSRPGAPVATRRLQMPQVEPGQVGGPQPEGWNNLRPIDRAPLGSPRPPLPPGPTRGGPVPLQPGTPGPLEMHPVTRDELAILHIRAVGRGPPLAAGNAPAGVNPAAGAQRPGPGSRDPTPYAGPEAMDDTLPQGAGGSP